jgi:hypothetical protein
MKKNMVVLHPPVLPSWGQMVPSSPPPAYGDINFDPDRLPLAQKKATANTDLDNEAISLLPEIFPSSKR